MISKSNVNCTDSNVKFADSERFASSTQQELRNYLKIKYNKTIIRFGFCDIRNNQGQGKCYQPKPITLTSTLIIPDITKTSSNNCLLFEKLKAAGRNCSETRENLTPALEEEEEKVKIL